MVLRTVTFFFVSKKFVVSFDYKCIRQKCSVTSACCLEKWYVTFDGLNACVTAIYE